MHFAIPLNNKVHSVCLHIQYMCFYAIQVRQYLCETLICSNGIDLDILAFLDEPQVGIVGFIVVHVKSLQIQRMSITLHKMRVHTEIKLLATKEQHAVKWRVRLM